MNTTIIIPCVRRSRFLEQATLPAIKAHTPDSVPIVIACEPDLNVSECRQKHMDQAETRYVYFMDVDSVIEQDEWLPILLDIMDECQAGAVTAAEHWNGMGVNKKPFIKTNVRHTQHRTAGAGVLYDRNVGAKWDPYLGETYGYIGRELEDVDFGYCIAGLGYPCIYTDEVAFNHAWHKESDLDSDEFAMWGPTDFFIRRKWKLQDGPARNNYFRLLHPLPTTQFEKNHDLSGISREDAMQKIYGDMVGYWGGDPTKMPDMDGCFPKGHRGPLLTTPEERGVEDIWSERYQEVKPRSPK